MRARLLPILLLAAAMRTAHAGCPDGDLDGACDAVDVCTNDGVVALAEATLRLTGADAPAGDERLRVRGRITVVPGLVADVDPATNGMRVLLERYDGQTGMRQALVSAVIPGGAGWRGRAEGMAWTYRDSRGTHGGVTRISVKRRPALPVIPASAAADARVAYDVQVLARRGDYLVDADLVDGFLPDAVVLDVGIGFGPVGADGSRCASRIFPSQSPAVPCAVSGGGSVAQCATAAPVGPCRVGEPRDVVLCEVMTLAFLQERWRALHGDYFAPSGQACDELPGYTSSAPTSDCVLVTQPGAFVVTATSPYAPGYECVYESAAPDGQRLTCTTS